jgi:allantoicase
MNKEEKFDSTFADKWINLAEERLGTMVLFATDDFFAEKENLIKPGRGIFIDDKYTDRGKWMDGWESRRKRVKGHDYCDIRLGLPGIIRAFDVDTNHFTGNHPESVSIEACCIDGEIDSKTKWTEILPQINMNPGSQHLVLANPIDKRFTHIRLHIFPDGGVARLRVFGEVNKDWKKVGNEEIIDLAAVQNEGKALFCSDMYFSHKDNINAPGRGVNMGDGWETKRRRGPGHDWLILALGQKGVIEKVEIDTAHFKGNFPDSCQIEGVSLESGDDPEAVSVKWKVLLAQTKLEADKQHYFSDLKKLGPITHARFSIYPDGGVSRLRLLGMVAE